MEKALMILGIIGAVSMLVVVITMVMYERRKSLATVITQLVFVIITFVLKIPELIIELKLEKNIRSTIFLMVLLMVIILLVSYKLVRKYKEIRKGKIIYLNFEE